MRLTGFTGATIDRADWMRNDSDVFTAALADPNARLLKLAGLDPEIDADGALVWTSLAEAPDGADLVLLGLEDGIAHFTAAIPGTPTPRGRPPAIFGLLDRMPRNQVALYAAARSVVDWHLRHGFCAVCGTKTVTFRAGWGRRCPSCNAEHFPRVDPVVIMIAEYEGRALLGRQRPWPAGRFSALAGFVEPGESIEEAVARETLEEAGVRVRNVRYVASQPWPFPSSLMIACIGEAEDDALTLDTNELEEAIWVTRDEVRASLAGEPAPFLPPPPFAIAHTLLTAWVEEG